MKKISMPVKADSTVNIKASDDVSIEGADQLIMTAVVRHSDTFKFSETGSKVDIKATSDLHIQLPRRQSVTIEKAGSDAHIAGLAQRVIIGKIGGDLALNDLAGASVEMVGGDVSLQRTDGAVEIARVGGDLIGNAVESVFSLAVGGDIFLGGVKGSLNLAAGGDVEVQLVVADLAEVSITAGGDVRLMVTPATNALLELVSNGNSIHLDACGQQGDWEQEQLIIPLGGGGNTIKVIAGGDIEVNDHDVSKGEFETRFENAFENWHDFGLELEKQIKESVAAATEDIQWATLGAVGASEKARMKVEKAMRKLDEKGIRIDSNGIHVEKSGKGGKSVNINGNGIHFEESDKVVGFTYPGDSKEKSGGQVTDEERIMVLKMLQDRKITLEEAEKLLSALEK